MDAVIIGGADGPTRIFLTGFTWYTIAPVAIVCVAVIGIIVWSIRNRNRKSNN